MWKEKYIPYYRILEAVLGDFVPHKEHEEIFKFISKEDWLLVPTEKETDMDDGKTRDIPNLYFSIREKTIGLGIVCHTIPSIRFFTNITHDFHSSDKQELSKLLTALDDRFTTGLSRKIKNYHFSQSPEYEPIIDFPTNTLDSRKIDQIIDNSDHIRVEGRDLMKKRKISWPPHTPAIYITRIEIPRSDQEFIDALKKLKPIYEIILNIKPTSEIKKILRKIEYQKEQLKKKDYGDFVHILNQARSLGLISAKERRDFDKRWRDNPELRNEITTDLKNKLNNY